MIKQHKPKYSFFRNPKCNPNLFLCPSSSQGVLKHPLGCVLTQRCQKWVETVSLPAVCFYHYRTPHCWLAPPAPQFPYSRGSLPYHSVCLEHLPGELLIPEVSAQGIKSLSPLLKASLQNGSLQVAGVGQHLPHLGHLTAPAV